VNIASSIGCLVYSCEYFTQSHHGCKSSDSNTSSAALHRYYSRLWWSSPVYSLTHSMRCLSSIPPPLIEMRHPCWNDHAHSTRLVVGATLWHPVTCNGQWPGQEECLVTELAFSTVVQVPSLFVLWESLFIILHLDHSTRSSTVCCISDKQPFLNTSLQLYRRGTYRTTVHHYYSVVPILTRCCR